MTASRGQHAAQPGHLEALCAKHSALEHRIREELKHPSTSHVLLSELKKRKLHLKEEIEREKHQRA